MLQDKVRNLELALSHLEAISAARIDEVITLTQKEIAAVIMEIETVSGKEAKARAQGARLQKQIAECQSGTAG